MVTTWLSWALSFLINFLSFVIFQVFWASWEFELSKVCEIWVRYKHHASSPLWCLSLDFWHYVFHIFFFFLVSWSSSFMPFHPCDVHLWFRSTTFFSCSFPCWFQNPPNLLLLFVACRYVGKFDTPKLGRHHFLPNFFIALKELRRAPSCVLHKSLISFPHVHNSWVRN